MLPNYASFEIALSSAWNKLVLLWKRNSTALSQQIELHLVNKPLLAAGISEDNAKAEKMSTKWIVGREAKLRGQLWNFEIFFSLFSLQKQKTI